MSGTIMSGRRGGVRLFSVISVTYPAGSVCTCTKGTKTYKAKDTSGVALFAVPEAGEWTVSCTDGTQTKSASVSITTEGQAVNVTLNYLLYLYNAGDECQDITGGWAFQGNIPESSAKQTDRIWTGNKVSSGNRSFFYMVNASPILKDYDTLKIKIERASVVDGGRIGLLKAETVPTNVNNDNYQTEFIAYSNLGTTDNVIALDISNVTYPGMRVLVFQLFSAYILQIWCE